MPDLSRSHEALSVTGWGDTGSPASTGQGSSGRAVDEVEKSALVRGSRPAAPTRWCRRRRRGSLKAAHVPLELGAREPAAAADMNRAKLDALHQGEERRAADAE